MTGRNATDGMVSLRPPVSQTNAVAKGKDYWFAETGKRTPDRRAATYMFKDRVIE